MKPIILKSEPSFSDEYSQNEYKKISINNIQSLWNKVSEEKDFPEFIILDGIIFKIKTKKFRDYVKKHYPNFCLIYNTI